MFLIILDQRLSSRRTEPLQNAKHGVNLGRALYINMGSAVVVLSTKSKTWLNNGGTQGHGQPSLKGSHPQTNPSLGFCRGAHFLLAHVFHFVVAAFGAQVVEAGKTNENNILGTC